MPNKQDNMELYHQQWREILKLLIEPKYKHAHIWYSSSEMWGYISYCGQRIRIDYSSQLHYVERLLQRK